MASPIQPNGMVNEKVVYIKLQQNEVKDTVEYTREALAGNTAKDTAEDIENIKEAKDIRDAAISLGFNLTMKINPSAKTFASAMNFQKTRKDRFPTTQVVDWDGGMAADAIGGKDGSVIFVKFGPGMRSSSAYRMTPNGKITQLTSTSRWNTYPSEGPDGKIVITKYVGSPFKIMAQDSGLYEIASQGESFAQPARLLVDNSGKDWDPAVSHSGRYVYYINGIFNPDADDPQNEGPTKLRCLDRLTKEDKEVGFGKVSVHPRAIPGSEDVLFCTKNKEGNFELWRVSPNGKTKQKILSSPTTVEGVKILHAIKPAVSPDGKWVAFKGVAQAGESIPGQPYYNTDIYIMRIDGKSSPMRLTYGMEEDSEPFFLVDGANVLLGFKSFRNGYDKQINFHNTDYDNKRVYFPNESELADDARHFLMDIRSLGIGTSP